LVLKLFVLLFCLGQIFGPRNANRFVILHSTAGWQGPVFRQMREMRANLPAVLDRGFCAAW
jgi:hypothetical protein